MNIFNNFVPTRILKFDHNKLVWMNNKIISCLKKISKLLKNIRTTPQVIIKICWLIQQLNAPDSLQKPREKKLTRLSARLKDSNTAPKTYWSILNQFLHNKKMPNIPAILVNGQVVSNFSEKVGSVVQWLLLHNFMHLSLNSGSAQVSNLARGVSEICDGEDL